MRPKPARPVISELLALSRLHGLSFESPQAVVALNGCSVHLARMSRSYARRAVEHPPIVPDNHLSRLPRMEIGFRRTKNLGASLREKGFTFLMFLTFNSCRREEAEMEHLLPVMPGPDGGVDGARE